MRQDSLVEYPSGRVRICFLVEDSSSPKGSDDLTEIFVLLTYGGMNRISPPRWTWIEYQFYFLK